MYLLLSLVFLLLIALLVIWQKERDEIRELKEKFEIFKRITNKSILEIENKISSLQNNNTNKETKDIKEETHLINKHVVNKIEKDEIQIPHKEQQQPKIEQINSIKEAFIKDEIKNYKKTAPLTGQKNNSEFEKVFLGNIFNKIAAIAIVIAICILVKMVSPYITLTPPMQIALGFLASIVMIFISLKLIKNTPTKTAQILMGTGIAGCLISTYTGCSYYELISIPLAFTIGMLIVAFSHLIAHKFNCLSVLVTGLFGAYLNPFFIDSSISVDFLFGYLIIINLMTMAYVNKNCDKTILNIINLILTTLCVTVFGIGKDVSLLYPVLLWVLYFVNDFLLVIKEKTSHDLAVLNWLNFASLTWFLNYVFKFEDKIATGSFLLLFAVIYITAQLAVNKMKNNIQNRIYLQNALLAILFSTFFLTNEIIRPSAWAVEALVASYLYTKFKYKDLRNFSLAYSGASITSIFFNNIIFNTFDTPFLNIRIVIFIIPAIVILLSSLILPKEEKKYTDILNFISISLIYLYIAFEINSIKALESQLVYTYITLGAIYLVNMQKLYNITQSNLYKTASYFIYAICMIALVCSTIIFNELNVIPFINLRCLSIIALIFATFILNSKEDMYKYLALFLGAVGIFKEFSSLFSQIFMQNIGILNTSSLILYAVVIILFGIFKNIKYLKTAGIWIVLFSVLKIVIADIYGVDPFFKLITLLILGLCLLAASHYYSKITKN